MNRQTTLTSTGFEWLENYLNIEYNGAVLVVSHDRYFLDKVVRKVWELEEHKIKIYRGNYSKYIETKNVEKLVGERAFKNNKRLLHTKRNLFASTLRDSAHEKHKADGKD